MLAGALAPAGCETMSQDFSDLGDKIMPTSPQTAARMMVDPYDADNRREGTVLIANSPFGGADAYLAVYRDRVAHETDPLVKAACINALGRYGAPRDAPAIALCLESSNKDPEHELVRWEAAKALQRIHDPQVVPALLLALRNPQEDTDTRVAAAIALGQYPQGRVFQGLVSALDAPELSVNAAARLSLTVLTGEDFGLDPRSWLLWYNGVEAPFANGQVYQYPTYKREETFLEKLAFWSRKTYEQPASPAGLEDKTKRRTYQDDDAPTDETGG